MEVMDDRGLKIIQKNNVEFYNKVIFLCYFLF